MIRAETRRVDYHALYPATVLSQDGAGGRWTCALTPRTSPPQAVPLRTLPGVKLTIPAGTRVLLGYEGGDPRAPVAMPRGVRGRDAPAVNGASTRAREGDDVAASASLSLRGWRPSR